LEKDYEMPDGVSRTSGASAHVAGVQPKAHAAPVQPKTPTDKPIQPVKAGISGLSVPKDQLPGKKQLDKRVDRAQLRATSLIEKATNPKDRLGSYWQLNDAYREADSKVREAMRKNPNFREIVKTATQALCNTFFKEGMHEKALYYVRGQVMALHRDLAAVVIEAAAPIFEDEATKLEKVAIFKSGETKKSPEKYLNEMSEHIKESALRSEANDAIRRLRHLIVVKPAPGPRI
jgi:hypothetical protein